MRTRFKRALGIFSREFWALPVADPAASFLRLVTYAWTGMFFLVYFVTIVVLVIGIFTGELGWLAPFVTAYAIVPLCAALVVLLPVLGALRHWRTQSPCARALRAVSWHHAICLSLLAAAVFLGPLNTGSVPPVKLLLILLAPQALHWLTCGIYFLPGLILVAAFHIGHGGALPGWRLPVLIASLAVASSAAPVIWLLYFQ